MAIGKGGSGMAWADFWALFDVENETERKILEEALANDKSFYRWFKRRSTKHQKEVLEGAPLMVVVELIHCLPREEAKKIAENFPKEDYEVLNRAYFNPSQGEDRPSLPSPQPVSGLPAGDKPGGRSVPVQKEIRGRT